MCSAANRLVGTSAFAQFNERCNVPAVLLAFINEPRRTFCDTVSQLTASKMDAISGAFKISWGTRAWTQRQSTFRLHGRPTRLQSVVLWTLAAKL